MGVSDGFGSGGVDSGVIFEGEDGSVALVSSLGFCVCLVSSDGDSISGVDLSAGARCRVSVSLTGGEVLTRRIYGF